MAKKLIELYEQAERDGIDVDWFPLCQGKSLSVHSSGGYDCIAIDPWKMNTVAEETVCLAHELGHCETGAFYNPYTPFDVVKKRENKADKWAIKMLISKKEIDLAVSDGIQDIPSLADHFGVTEEFMKKAVCYYTYGNLNTELYF